MDNHLFSPSRPGGTVCIEVHTGGGRGPVPDVEYCGYPAGHPIHDTANTPAEARTGISDRAAAALADVAYLRGALRGQAMTPSVVDVGLEALDRIEAALRGGDAR